MVYKKGTIPKKNRHETNGRSIRWVRPEGDRQIKNTVKAGTNVFFSKKKHRLRDALIVSKTISKAKHWLKNI